MCIKRSKVKIWFALLFLVSISFISSANVSNNDLDQNERISISNKGQYSETVIIYFLSENDSIVKWVRIGSYYLQSGHTIGFLIESLNEKSNYGYKVKGGSNVIKPFIDNHIDLN